MLLGLQFTFRKKKKSHITFPTIPIGQTLMIIMKCFPEEKDLLFKGSDVLWGPAHKLAAGRE